MANNNTIERTVVATSVQEQSTAEFNGWSLNFTTQSEGDQVKSINVNGQKEQSSVNASISESGYMNVGYSGVRDNALTVALMDEMDAIMNGE